MSQKQLNFYSFKINQFEQRIAELEKRLNIATPTPPTPPAQPPQPTVSPGMMVNPPNGQFVTSCIMNTDSLTAEEKIRVLAFMASIKEDQA